jgi:hypothetical protein
MIGGVSMAEVNWSLQIRTTLLGGLPLLLVHTSVPPDGGKTGIGLGGGYSLWGRVPLPPEEREDLKQEKLTLLETINPGLATAITRAVLISG